MRHKWGLLLTFMRDFLLNAYCHYDTQINASSILHYICFLITCCMLCMVFSCAWEKSCSLLDLKSSFCAASSRGPSPGVRSNTWYTFRPSGLGFASLKSTASGLSIMTPSYCGSMDMAPSCWGSMSGFRSIIAFVYLQLWLLGHSLHSWYHLEKNDKNLLSRAVIFFFLHPLLDSVLISCFYWFQITCFMW